MGRIERADSEGNDTQSKRIEKGRRALSRNRVPLIIGGIISTAVLILIAMLMQSDDDDAEVVNMDSQEFKDLREQARIDHSGKRYEQAIIKLKGALKMRPQNSEVWNDLGATYYALGLEFAGSTWPSWERDLTANTISEGNLELETALREVESGYLVFICTHEMAKRIEQNAKQKGSQVSNRHWSNNSKKVNILVGRTKEFFLKARDSYVAAIDIKPAYDAPYQNLGALYIKIGQLDVGKDNLEKAYKLDPRNDELRMYLRQFKSKEFVTTSKVLTLDEKSD